MQAAPAVPPRASEPGPMERAWHWVPVAAPADETSAAAKTTTASTARRSHVARTSPREHFVTPTQQGLAPVVSGGGRTCLLMRTGRGQALITYVSLKAAALEVGAEEVLGAGGRHRGGG